MCHSGVVTGAEGQGGEGFYLLCVDLTQAYVAGWPGAGALGDIKGNLEGGSVGQRGQGIL